MTFKADIKALLDEMITVPLPAPLVEKPPDDRVLVFEEPLDDEDMPKCPYCHGTGLSPEGWDCEECDGNGYWEV